MNKTIRIGTRDSKLAMWQAKTVQKQLEDLGYTITLVPIKSTGDIILDIPLYEMNMVDVFTKTLDDAMLCGKIDLAVHSMKDMPTELPKEIVLTAVLKRGSTSDILVYKDPLNLEAACTIATSSLRRKAQWLHRFPNHNLVSLRGNVIKRLAELKDNDWHGAIFAKAGLERIGVLPKEHISLDWMLPAPAQGAVAVVAMKNDPFVMEASKKLNVEDSFRITYVERMFLRELENGVSAPIAALAHIENDTIYLKGNLFSIDGKKNLQVAKACPVAEYITLGQKAAQDILHQGGRSIMDEIKESLFQPKIT